MPSLIVHGGAWQIPDSLEQPSLLGCQRAAQKGFESLKNGGTAIDAVEVAIKVLEDDVSFDAGTGSVLNEEGQVEMDAIICDGTSRKFGAVCCLKNTLNPIAVARAVMEKTNHCVLAGEGATKFARKQGFGHVATADLVTEAARQEFEQFKRYNRAVTELFNGDSKTSHDTVGCVAMDDLGNICAGTSTGGITAKMSGRVGDSPIIGAGAYCDSKFAGVSTTGHGESLLQANLASDVVYRLKFQPGWESGRKSDFNQSAKPARSTRSAQSALDASLVDMFELTTGRGGAIMIDSDGNCYHSCTTSKMVWASMDKSGCLTSGIKRQGPSLVVKSNL